MGNPVELGVRALVEEHDKLGLPGRHVVVGNKQHHVVVHAQSAVKRAAEPLPPDGKVGQKTETDGRRRSAEDDDSIRFDEGILLGSLVEKDRLEETVVGVHLLKGGLHGVREEGALGDGDVVAKDLLVVAPKTNVHVGRQGGIVRGRLHGDVAVANVGKGAALLLLDRSKVATSSFSHAAVSEASSVSGQLLLSLSLQSHVPLHSPVYFFLWRWSGGASDVVLLPSALNDAPW